MDMIIVNVFMMVVIIELFPFISLSVTLIVFPIHNVLTENFMILSD